MQARGKQKRRVDEGPPGRPPTASGPGGNILTKHHEGSNPLTMAYDAANRLTTSILGSTQLTTYSYSNAGEMTEERCDSVGIRATFVYDGEQRCVNEVRATTSTYTYAVDGLRRSAHQGGAANPITFVWDGTDLLNEYILGGVSTRYDVLDGEVIAEKRGASRYVYGADPLGSVVHLLDSALNRAATYVYWPYGEVQSHTGVDTPMQFVGRLGYYTSTTNRVYVRARWLRPDLARWLTEDPIGFEGGDWNLYGYVDDGPTGATDPTGHRKWCIHLPFRNCIGNGCKGDRHCRPRGGDVKDLATCLGQDCRGMTGEELAACLGKCLGKGAIDANCSEIVCSVPQWKHFCQNGDPCKKKSAFKYYQDCCEIAYYCCLGTRGLTGLIACQLEHKACTCGYGEIK